MCTNLRLWRVNNTWRRKLCFMDAFLETRSWEDLLFQWYRRPFRVHPKFSVIKNMDLWAFPSKAQIVATVEKEHDVCDNQGKPVYGWKGAFSAEQHTLSKLAIKLEKQPNATEQDQYFTSDEQTKFITDRTQRGCIKECQEADQSVQNERRPRNPSAVDPGEYARCLAFHSEAVERPGADRESHSPWHISPRIFCFAYDHANQFYIDVRKQSCGKVAPESKKVSDARVMYFTKKRFTEGSVGCSPLSEANAIVLDITTEVDNESLQDETN
ncbi:hypothetical protein DFJ58DRAFT_843074 [Suillus subalutaceus]|uniref:uncharacterized protein n=1 Tax=Suillus subalutaceus TaxID=48586 RepID=UPI001B86606A|nr:uncharacterized protein DFJ58DRAFT_843074 [Suillus subalutaceus]KAG1847869.1 hypothetical protein DFJ58DRAFT_843074 [Suillus subalutaceus]